MSHNHRRVILGSIVLVFLAGGDSALVAQSATKSGEKRDFSKLPRFEISKIVDAGTLTLRNEGKNIDVHLVGVDVPDDESDSGRATQFLEQLLLGESVYVETIDHVESAGTPPGKDLRKDRANDAPMTAKPVAGRDDAQATPISDGSFVYAYRVPDGLFVNLELVRQAYTRVSARPKFDQLETFRTHETRARDKGNGVWEDGRARDSKYAKPGGREAKNGEGGAKPGVKSGETNGDVTVYVTKSGKKYHKQDCQFITQGSTAISLTDAAKRGLDPCSKCKPPPKH